MPFPAWLCRLCLPSAGLRLLGSASRDAGQRPEGRGRERGSSPGLLLLAEGAQQWQQQLSKLTAQNPDLSPCAPAPEGSCFLHLFLLLPSYLTFVLVLQ